MSRSRDSFVINKIEIGAGGGIISMVITYPLVAISSRLQVQSMNNMSSEKDAYKVNAI
jgi:hypothetical protein